MDHRFMRAAAAAAGVLLLAACDVGVTDPPTHVADTSAVLEGTLQTDDAGTTLTWWFEYGPTTSYGSTTAERTATFLPGRTTPIAVEATVTGLAHGTTYHYRTCVRNARGGGLCGAARTFTTTSGRDSVHGLGVSFEIIDQGFTIGVDIDASSAPNGSSATGQAARSPGLYYERIWDAGPVTCLRAEDDMATVGFVGDYSVNGLPPVNLVVYVDDNGSSGDRFAVDIVASTPTSCPDPDDLTEASWQTLIRGDLVVHDHP